MWRIFGRWRRPRFERLLEAGDRLRDRHDLAGARARYALALEAAPRHPGVLRRMGMLLAAQGERAEAARHLEAALEAGLAGDAACHYDLGCLYYGAKRLDAAEAHFRKALEADAGHGEALNNLGCLLRDKGEMEEAERQFRLALERAPGLAPAYFNLAALLRVQDRLPEALTVLREAAARFPDSTKILVALAEALRETALYDESIAALEAALRLDPSLPEPYVQMGLILQEKREPERAIALYREALELDPENLDARHNLALCLHDVDRVEEAERTLLELRAQYPEKAAIFNLNLGNVYHYSGRYEEGLACFEKALAASPSLVEGHVNRGFMLLLQGELAEGFREYEWRLWFKEMAVQRPCMEKYHWEPGMPLAGKTILLHTEQGFGDMIQFIRYAPLVAAQGATVLFDCLEEQRSLLAGVPGIARLQTLEAAQDIDICCPVMSLPYLFGTTLQTIPAEVPYLFVDAPTREKWAARIGAASGRPKVGLVWGTNPQNRIARYKSTTLETFLPLARLGGEVEFYSLQKGDAAAQVRAFKDRFPLVDWMDEVADFRDTAGLILQLDLVIAVDTAVAHLAGALGKPVWTLLPFVPDWRWLLEREDSPWYPSMRLFRQKRLHDWSGALEDVVAALEARLRQGDAPGAR